MPHPNIKRVRSARYAGSMNHFNEMNSLQSTKRTPQWSQIVQNRNNIANINTNVNVPGGNHTLGDATNTGNLTFASDSVVNKSLVLGNGVFNSVSQTFSIPNTGNFVWTHANTTSGVAIGGGDLIVGNAPATGTGSIEILITPTLKGAGLTAGGSEMSQADLDAFNPNDIITLSGFQDLSAGAGTGIDESWLNGVYQVTDFTDDGAGTRTGIKLQRARAVEGAPGAVTYAALTRDTAAPILGVIPSATGHNPVLTKHFRIRQYFTPGGAVVNYI